MYHFLITESETSPKERRGMHGLLGFRVRVFRPG